MKKRLIAILMVLTLVLTYMPALAFADDGEFASDKEAAYAELEKVESEAKNAYEEGNGVVYYIADGTSYACVYYAEASLSGAFTIPGYINASNGVTYPVTYIDYDAFYGQKNLTGVTIPTTITRIDHDAFVNTGLTSVSIPPTVTSIASHAFGFNEDSNGYSLVPGFTIFGTTGTEAQRYANANGILFRDLAAEAEAARQGTPDPKIPKVKVKKAKPAKTSFTIKWKKLSKKQLKKSKATHYEVWTCRNKAFGPNDTDVKIFSKKYSSLKLRGATRKTVYYYKIRAIRYVGGTKMVGKWSAVKKVKTK